ncbi:MAG: hypothetical protein HDR50_10255 [Desulfovibrio sp.]|uniref:hypothetical protein n=1 Tax=Desulfovibrio sp. TaxID=885 RepID=UPI001A73ECF4|nr:hypothetical protein [Desulfovibrio sp.]MBD5418010.1 hypothetical protein [Desulfovibrio sp.]
MAVSFAVGVVAVLPVYRRNYPSKTAFLLLATSEKNFLGRVLKYTPFGNYFSSLPATKNLIF